MFKEYIEFLLAHRSERSCVLAPVVIEMDHKYLDLLGNDAWAFGSFDVDKRDSVTKIVQEELKDMDLFRIGMVYFAFHGSRVLKIAHEMHTKGFVSAGEPADTLGFSK